MRAIRRADLEAIQLYCTIDDKDINACDAEGFTPLMAAAKLGNARAVQHLLDAGADVHTIDAQGWMASDYLKQKKIYPFGRRDHADVPCVILAELMARKGRKDCKMGPQWYKEALKNVRGYLAHCRLVSPPKPFLLEFQEIIDLMEFFIFTYGESALKHMLKDHSVAIINSEKGGQAPLMAAINHMLPFKRVPKGEVNMRGIPNIVRVLLKARAHTEIREKNDMTPLLCAARNNHASIVASLLEAGADKNAQDSEGYTPLMKAVEAYVKQMDVLQMLLNAKCDIEKRNLAGKTALKVAVESRRIEAIQLLIEQRADVNAADKQGTTPLMESAVCDDLPITNLLIAAKCDLAAKDHQGNTALHRAARASTSEKSVAMIQRLLKAKACPAARNHEGHTALMEAAFTGNPGVALKFIAQSSFKVEQTDAKRAAQIAIKNSFSRFAHCLTEAGVTLK